LIEKIIENWLDKSTERVFQMPFCYFLLKKGHTVLHITRHCGMELGKDIITLNEKGIPCAFQLKTGNISLQKWRDELSSQIIDLTYGKVTHPSIKTNERHIPYLVTNGKIEEEAQCAINDFNATLTSNNLPKLEIIVKGEILKQAIELRKDLWSYDENDFASLLRILLEDGRELFPKKEFAAILEQLLRLNNKEEKYSKPKIVRMVSNAAILTSLCLSNYTKNDNHFAEIEAWTIYLSYLNCLLEKTSNNTHIVQTEIAIAHRAITNSIKNLIEELKGRKNILEGESMVDSNIIGVRRTIICALLSIYPLLMCEQNDEIAHDDKYFIMDFIQSNLRKMQLWGEAAIPQYLSVILYLKCFCGEPTNDFILSNLVEGVSMLNGPHSLSALPNPYYQATDILPILFEKQLAQFLPAKYLQPIRPIKDSFSGTSFTLEGLVNIYVKRLWKQQLKLLWCDITKISLISFKPKEKWHYWRWHNDEGQESCKYFNQTQEWEKLVNDANNLIFSDIPISISEYPAYGLLFLIVVPHRWNTEVVKLIDSEISPLKYRA
jgi:hypothetical protein